MKIKPEDVPDEAAVAAFDAWLSSAGKDRMKFVVAAALNAWPGAHEDCTRLWGVPSGAIIVLPVARTIHKDEVHD